MGRPGLVQDDSSMKKKPSQVLDTLEDEGRADRVESASTNVPLFFFGTLLILMGLSIYFLGIVFSIFRLAFHLGEPYRTWNQTVAWYSGIPTTFGVLLGSRSRLLASAQAQELAA